ncbi:hypothetical protein DP73_03510 [Desulfosporosinus sp. HMP52]|uniref:hypothetical protein n=1 Tax=Desulfosporosinus sp. HMP52 TaxID=1487923 RepID=UPI00051F8B8A|nr:hypothetical protein [Desulfosporosinus sp. HMP52]KGK91486.1 hypothetical protein DP73_03510 [Desulfosporosinus sp. HMP52]
MKEAIIFALKNLTVIIITILTFGSVSKLIGGVGNMPKSLIHTYGESIFVSNGVKLPAIIVLCSLIMVFLLINFNLIKDGIHNNRHFKGLIYGCSFGILWFFGFTELIVIFDSGNFSHIESSIRDFMSLTVFGLLSGMLLCKSEITTIKRTPRSLMAVPFVAIMFAFFHGAQYYFTLEPINLRINSFIDILWLLTTGGWIGFMYYLFSPGIKFKNKYVGIIFFSYSVFGTNWLLYTSFYNIFLAIPLWDVILRCLTSCTGVLVGLTAYQYLLVKQDSNFTQSLDITQ